MTGARPAHLSRRSAKSHGSFRGFTVSCDTFGPATRNQLRWSSVPQMSAPRTVAVITGEGTRTVENMPILRTDQVAEERDLVGVYLHEISRTPLLDAVQEVELSKSIEAGLLAEHWLEDPDGRPEG